MKRILKNLILALMILSFVFPSFSFAEVKTEVLSSSNVELMNPIVTISYSVDGKVTNVNEIQPEVLFNGRRLRKDIDYKLSIYVLSKNKWDYNNPSITKRIGSKISKEGEYKLVISGIGNYSGKVSKYFIVSTSRIFESEYSNEIYERKGNPNIDEMTVYLTGDLMCPYRLLKNSLNNDVLDFSNTLKYITPILSEADFVVGNLETAICKDMTSTLDRLYILGRPYMNAPESFVSALKHAGFTNLVLANNHVLDCGDMGIDSTLKACENNGIDTVGLYDKSGNDNHYMILTKGDIKVGIIAYATYYNHREDQLSKEYLENSLSMYKKKQAEKDIKALKEEGANYIICYIHGGTEFTTTVDKNMKRIYSEVANLGADYIVSSHPHVLQEYYEIKTGDDRVVPCICSLGNLIATYDSKLRRESAILELNLKIVDGKVVLNRNEYIGTYVVSSYKGEKYVILPETMGISELKDRYLEIDSIIQKKNKNLKKAA